MLSPNCIFKVSELGSLLLFTFFCGENKAVNMKAAITGCNFEHTYKF